jgi:biotin carboxyl carrier protein
MRIEVESEVQGSVWKVEVAEGDTVKAGDVLIILESMKMEIPVEAPVDGTVAELLAAPEDPVAEDQVLAVIETGA